MLCCSVRSSMRVECHVPNGFNIDRTNFAHNIDDAHRSSSISLNQIWNRNFLNFIMTAPPPLYDSFDDSQNKCVFCNRNTDDIKCLGDIKFKYNTNEDVKRHKSQSLFVSIGIP